MSSYICFPVTWCFLLEISFLKTYVYSNHISCRAVYMFTGLSFVFVMPSCFVTLMFKVSWCVSLDALGFSRWAGFLSFPESGVGFCCRDVYSDLQAVVYWLKCTIRHVITVIWLLWLMPASNQSHAFIISLVSLSSSNLYFSYFPFLVFLSVFKHFNLFLLLWLCPSLPFPSPSQ